MENEEKKQLVEKTVSQINRINKIINDYADVINSITDNYAVMFAPYLTNVIEKDELHWQSQLDKAKKDVSYCPNLIERLEKIKTAFQDKEYIESLAPQYIKLVNSEINSDSNINKIASCTQNILPYIENIFKESCDFNLKKDTFQYLASLFNASDKFAYSFLQRLAQLDTFEYFKCIEHSIVIIGANGSGKSSFSRNTRKVLAGNVAIISAQKIFNIQRIKSVPLGDQPLQTVHAYQENDKLGKGIGNQNDYGSDLNNLMVSLVAEHTTDANQYFEDSKAGAVDRKLSVLEQVIEVWCELITHRCMKYKSPEIKIFDPKNAENEEYEFFHLSDGEKAVFYYIAHILLAKENSFIIVDEPENHLHMGVVSKLWDKLEGLRDDCKFIYLTHNLDFASSRVHSTKLWNKSFTTPANWDVTPLPSNEELPESLLMELLGSRKIVLFCEGDKSSLDYKLYTLLFPNYTIKPAGGHIDVINYTRAFNKSKDIFGNSAFGIIDGDFHLDAAKIKWEKDSIFCVEAQEVENILCDELLLEAGRVRFCCDTDDCVEEAKEQLFKELKQKKEWQAVQYATQKINNILKSNLLEKTKTKDELQTQFNCAIENIDINLFIEDRISEFDRILEEQSYDCGVKYYNSKGLVGLVGDKIVVGYRNRVFGLLKDEPELLEKIREKYFPRVPITGDEVAND